MEGSTELKRMNLNVKSEQNPLETTNIGLFCTEGNTGNIPPTRCSASVKSPRICLIQLLLQKMELRDVLTLQ